MTDIDLVSNALGYTRSSDNWVHLSEAANDPATAYLYRRAKDAGAISVYVFQTSPEDMRILPHRPAVYLSYASDDSEADEIRRKLWLLGNAPFIIVVLPEHVRVYTGFDYRRDNQQDAGLIVPDVSLGVITEALKDFHADEIDSGRIWERQAKHLTIKNRVDQRLLRNLEDLGDELVNKLGLRIDIAHNLIGKYIYIRYLRDRNILSDLWLAQQGLAIDQVLGSSATLDGLRRLNKALEERFNGGVFPLDLINLGTDDDDRVIAYIAGVVKGDEAQGQLALDFDIYDFSYIPIELLSSIYEQFLRRQEPVGQVGAYYTPEPVADYLVSELNYIKPLKRGMQVLDPCCGSGIFLVLVYRRLIEIALAQKESHSLTPLELSDILTSSIYGVERNLDACYVTEFSLLLTLLSYVDPPELDRYGDFKFPFLHNKHIFECDFFDDQSAFWQLEIRFDWVIGNTPWVELTPSPSEGKDRDAPARAWMQTANTKPKDIDNPPFRPVARNRVSDAFCWRATDVLHKKGYVGLYIPAKSLTNEQCQAFRQEFFKQNTVHRITNFSNLSYILFSGRAKHPAATLIYTKYIKECPQPAIVHYGPFVVNQTPDRSLGGANDQAWSVTIYENEIQTVSYEEAITGRAEIWKIALWGNLRDQRTYSRLLRLFPKTLIQLCQEKQWKLQLGLQLRHVSSSEEIEALRELGELPLLNNLEMTASGFKFRVPKHVLHPIPAERQYIRSRGGKAGLQIAHAPHLFLTINFAAYSDYDFVLPHPQIGLSANREDADHLRAISMLLSSSLMRYLLFFQSSAWGIRESTVGLHAVQNIPIPSLNSEQIGRLADVQRELSDREFDLSVAKNAPVNLFTEDEDTERKVPSGASIEFQTYLDEQVEQILLIPNQMRIVIQDFMNVRYQSLQGKHFGPATTGPTDDQLLDYGHLLAHELDNFVDEADKKHRVTLIHWEDAIACEIEYIRSDVSIEPSIVRSGEAASRYQSVWQSLKQRFSQWIYVQRGLRMFDGNTIRLLKPNRLMDWTKTQALLDTGDILGEVLSYRREIK